MKCVLPYCYSFTTTHKLVSFHVKKTVMRVLGIVPALTALRCRNIKITTKFNCTALPNSNMPWNAVTIYCPGFAFAPHVINHETEIQTCPVSPIVFWQWRPFDLGQTLRLAYIRPTATAQCISIGFIFKQTFGGTNRYHYFITKLS